MPNAHTKTAVKLACSNTTPVVCLLTQLLLVSVFLFLFSPHTPTTRNKQQNKQVASHGSLRSANKKTRGRPKLQHLHQHLHLRSILTRHPDEGQPKQRRSQSQRQRQHRHLLVTTRRMSGGRPIWTTCCKKKKQTKRNEAWNTKLHTRTANNTALDLAFVQLF